MAPAGHYGEAINSNKHIVRRYIFWFMDEAVPIIGLGNKVMTAGTGVSWCLGYSILKVKMSSGIVKLVSG